MNKKNLFDTLENAEDNSMEMLTDNCPDISDEQLEKLLSESERRYTMKKKEIEKAKETTNAEYNEESVSGVDRVKRPVWVRPLAIAASVVLIAGTVAGSIALMKNAKPDKNTQSAAVTTTQATAINKEDIDQDYIIDLVQNYTDNFDRLYFKCKERRTNRKDRSSDEYSEIEVQLDKQNDFLWKERTMNYRDNTYPSVHAYYYWYAGRRLVVDPEERHCEVQFEGTPPALELSYRDGASWLINENKDIWSITGYDTVCGKECAVVEIRGGYFNAEMFIDIKTGVVMKETDDYHGTDATSLDLYIEFEVTEIRYDDEAGDFVTPPEFRKFIEDGNYTMQYICDLEKKRCDEDLSFLDMPLKHPDNNGNDKTDVPENITQEWLRDLNKNAAKNFDKCYMECSENGELWIKAVDNKNGIIYKKAMESDIIDYAYNGKRITLWKENGNAPSVIENPAENLRLFDYGDLLDDFSLWSVEGTKEYNGRKCAVIRYTPRQTGAADEFKGTATQYIDLETGIIIGAFAEENGNRSWGTETMTFHVNDAATEIPTPQDIKKLIADGGYTVEEGLDLSFLDMPQEQQTEATTAPAVTADETATESETTATPEQTAYTKPVFVTPKPENMSFDPELGRLALEMCRKEETEYDPTVCEGGVQTDNDDHIMFSVDPAVKYYGYDPTVNEYLHDGPNNKVYYVRVNDSRFSDFEGFKKYAREMYSTSSYEYKRLLESYATGFDELEEGDMIAEKDRRLYIGYRGKLYKLFSIAGKGYLGRRYDEEYPVIIADKTADSFRAIIPFDREYTQDGNNSVAEDKVDFVEVKFILDTEISNWTQETNCWRIESDTEYHNGYHGENNDEFYPTYKELADRIRAN